MTRRRVFPAIFAFLAAEFKVTAYRSILDDDFPLFSISLKTERTSSSVLHKAARALSMRVHHSFFFAAKGGRVMLLLHVPFADIYPGRPRYQIGDLATPFDQPFSFVPPTVQLIIPPTSPISLSHQQKSGPFQDNEGIEV